MSDPVDIIAVAVNNGLAMTEDLAAVDNSDLAMTDDVATLTFNQSLHSGMYGLITIGDPIPIEIDAMIVATITVLAADAVGGNLHNKSPLPYCKGDFISPRCFNMRKISPTDEVKITDLHNSKAC